MKDPACLFYIDTWLSATAEMDSDVRGWYLNLILHQYDKKDLPNDAEKLAVLAGVKFSEFQRFKQMLEQVLMHKFKVNESGRLENSFAKSILEGRDKFKEKRAKSGNIGVVIKIALQIDGFTNEYIERLKDDLYLLDEDEINKHKDKQMLKQMLKLYINENGNKDITKSKNKNEVVVTEIEKQSIEVLTYLNQQANRKFRVNVKSNLANIKARLIEGNDIQTLFDIVDLKCYEWLNDAKMHEYLQPDTLFNPTKFEKYLEQLTRAKSNPEQFKNNADVRKQQSKSADGLTEMQRYKQQLINELSAK